MRIKNKYGKRTVKQPLLVHFKLGPDSQRAVLVVNQYYLFIHFSRWALVNGASSEILKIIPLFFLLIIQHNHNSLKGTSNYSLFMASPCPCLSRQVHRQGYSPCLLLSAPVSRQAGTIRDWHPSPKEKDSGRFLEFPEWDFNSGP